MKTKVLMMLVVGVMLSVANIASATIIQGIDIDLVTIGNPGNPGDTRAEANPSGCGAVAYEYQIGKYEVTNAQWNAFVSAAGAPTGNPSNAYDQSAPWTGMDVPVNMVSWYEAAQFCNYLTSGDKSQGAYLFSGNNTNPGDFLGIDRDLAVSTFGVAYFIPTEDEWYKAAYYTGSGYSTYANGTDAAPMRSHTNYESGQPWDVGTGTMEQNSTFDMMGNVWEWNEAFWLGDYGPLCRNRGGSWGGQGTFLASSWRGPGLESVAENANGGFRVASIPEPATPPVADADGPYSIYVGDALTLNASGSTDADDDIVSYMWDLNDDETFETDAGGQPIFDVNYTYLQSLGLLVDHTYNIHVQATDSEGQSDVADSTLIIVPRPATVVAVDIKPGSCPNPVNVKSSGVLPVAILGTADFDANTIDATSVRLAGVEPLRNSIEDVATPVSDSNDCNCTTDGPDGFLDLTLKFKTQLIVEAIGDVNDGDVLRLELTGVLFGEGPIEGADCIMIRGRHKPINPADINKDGVVNAADFAIFAQNWLQSSIVDE